MRKIIALLTIGWIGETCMASPLRLSTILPLCFLLSLEGCRTAPMQASSVHPEANHKGIELGDLVFDVLGKPLSDSVGGGRAGTIQGSPSLHRYFNRNFPPFEILKNGRWRWTTGWIFKTYAAAKDWTLYVKERELVFAPTSIVEVSNAGGTDQL